MKNFFSRLIILVALLSSFIAIANSRFYIFPDHIIVFASVVTFSILSSLWTIQNRISKRTTRSRYLILGLLLLLGLGLIVWKSYFPHYFNILHTKVLNGLTVSLGFFLLYGFFKKPSLGQEQSFTKKKIIFRLIFPLILLIGTAIWIYANPIVSESSEDRTYTILWILLSGALIILALSLLDFVLNKILAWKKFPGLRFFFQMVLGTGLSLLCLNLSFDFLRSYYTEAAPDTGQLIVMNLYGSALILPIFSLYFGYQFLRDWRRSELESERLMKENARSQMMSLKNHLDPHFLFNNLNILSSLMDKDVSLSKDYLDKFASVYRIILKAEHSDLTLLEDELQLVDAYIYLLKTRFEGSVIFELDIDKKHMDKGIPPLAIQMLIENAIKHNMASSDSPIKIRILTSGDHIIIENNIQKKKYFQQDHRGSGLENIKARYAFFSDRPMKVEETEDIFRVTLPLIKIDYD